MTKNNINPYLIPQINSTAVNKSAPANKEIENAKEFQELLDQNISEKSSVKENLEFSGHALRRMKQRNLTMDNDEYLKLKDGIEKLKNKGGQDSLIVTNKAAYIVDVANNKVVTAMDKEDMSENVFTKIDSTLFIN